MRRLPPGKSFTVNELLGRAETLLSDSIRQTSLTAQSCSSISRKYVDQDEDSKARRILEQATVSRGSRTLFSRSGRMCFGIYVRPQNLAARRGPIQEGLRELPKFSGSRWIELRLLSGSWVASGDSSQEAIARSQAARDLLAASPLRSEITDLRVQLSLAESYRAASQYRNAILAYEQVSALMTALGRDDTETAGTMFNNWAFALQLSGRPLEAERYYRRAIEISRSGESEEGVSPMLLTNYARTLRELGLHTEAAGYAERAYAKAQLTGNQVVMNQSLLVGARIYREQGNFIRAEAMLSEVEPRLRKASPPGNLAFATVATEYSLLAFARGDSPSALQLANQALEITEAAIKAGQGGDDYLARVLIPRSDIERQIGRADDAAMDAARAVTILRKIAEPGVFSSYLGHAYYALGLALQDQGKSEEARAAFRSAVEYLQATLGPAHPDSRSARQLATSETQHQ